MQATNLNLMIGWDVRSFLWMLRLKKDEKSPTSQEEYQRTQETHRVSQRVLPDFHAIALDVLAQNQPG
jgi:hypothetical protein